MINIVDKEQCCGCGACVQRCPKHCITMREDGEGFLYPHVDETDCIGCQLCEKVCHEIHPMEEREPAKVIAAINKDEPTRLASSSGGIFSILAEKTIMEGGVVFGARFDEQWQVVIDYAETMEDVKPFVGSKYVQARTGTSYTDAERFLRSGRKVLYSGTPCQIAGLHHYLRKYYDNLTTVDFVCHGVPSPKVWRMYINEVLTATQKINDIKFRDKRNGWKRFNFVLSYSEHEDSLSLYSFHGENHYMRAFLSDMILRQSCYNCKAKCGRSHSDITIADFWGIKNVHPEIDDNKGTGLVLINTDKGNEALDWSKLYYVEATLDEARPYNGGLSPQTKSHPMRMEFFEKLDKTESVIDFIDSSLKPSFKQKVKILPGICKRFIIKMLKSKIGGGKTERIELSYVAALSLPVISQGNIIAINFRNKDRGWKQYRMEIVIEPLPDKKAAVYES